MTFPLITRRRHEQAMQRLQRHNEYLRAMLAASSHQQYLLTRQLNEKMDPPLGTHDDFTVIRHRERKP